MVIYPEVIVTPDTPTVRFNQPRKKIDLEVELPRILLREGWGCGTYFNVQFLNHEKTKVMACARFVVSEELENTQTNDANPYQPMTKTVFLRHAAQIEDWWVKTEPKVDDKQPGDTIETHDIKDAVKQKPDKKKSA